MHKILTIIAIFLSLFCFSQTNNRFFEENEAAGSYGGKQEEKLIEEADANPNETRALGNDPGDPGDVVPIDDYLPLLVVTAIGMIGYAGFRKRKQTA